ncbi:energy transducer TonB, partial [Pseudomonas sp. S4_EA_1b]|nr:energy transducer TonB [Pseudomonas sp. S4_EA_1b]
MTAQMPITPPTKTPRPLRPLKWGAGLLLGAVAAWLLWQWANDMSGVRREAPKVPTIIPLPPPPPP